MQYSYNKVFCDYFEYILNILNMCLIDIGLDCFPWMGKLLEKPLTPKPSPIFKKKTFEKYTDDDYIEKEYDLV